MILLMKDNLHGITVEPVWNLPLGIPSSQMIGKKLAVKIVLLWNIGKKSTIGMICLAVA